MGAEAAQIHVSSSHVGVEGDISTQNTQILLHVELTLGGDRER